MREVIVLVEGQTEERFIKDLVAPSLRSLDVFVKPMLMPTSKKSSGGAVSYERLRFNARNALLGKTQPFVSTFLDLYHLDTSFPASNLVQKMANLKEKVLTLNTALHESIINYVDCRPARFIPHIQPHEFEALLFSDPKTLANTDPSWRVHALRLQKIRDDFETPEHINGGANTHPSMRLGGVVTPAYRKTLHAPVAAKNITLSVIERECFHFSQWMQSLRALGSRV